MVDSRAGEEQQKQPEELKPCPFCGGEATITHALRGGGRSGRRRYGVVAVTCRNMGCPVFARTLERPSSEEAEAIAAWNRRAGEVLSPLPKKEQQPEGEEREKLWRLLCDLQVFTPFTDAEWEQVCTSENETWERQRRYADAIIAAGYRRSPSPVPEAGAPTAQCEWCKREVDAAELCEVGKQCRKCCKWCERTEAGAQKEEMT